MWVIESLRRMLASRPCDPGADSDDLPDGIPIKPDAIPRINRTRLECTPRLRQGKSRSPPVYAYAAFSISRLRECFCSYSSGVR